MNDSKRRRHNDGGGRGRGRGGGDSFRKRQHPNSNNSHHQPNHRFGRVMSQPPKLKLNPNRSSNTTPTVSIAIPGSVVSNAQTRELQTQLAGQIARAAAVFRIDEIIVFDDGLGSVLKTFSNYRRGPRKREGEDDNHKKPEQDTAATTTESNNNNYEKREEKPLHMQPSTDPRAFLARILQYIECPQYLRRKFFPMHPDLQFAGLLPPLDAPHHLRRGDVASFREGVVVDSKDTSTGGGGSEEGSFVDCGVPNRLVQINRVLTPGIRCTVQLDPPTNPKQSRLPKRD
ncbi:hypothetical protein ACHAXR_010991 [Thalassiosira sp. AJA248-18]